MKKTVILKLEVVGHHNYPTPPNAVNFLRYEHRHIFKIEVGVSVSHNNRETEIFLEQAKIKKYLNDKFKCKHLKEYQYLIFYNMSCEDIAEDIINTDENYTYVEVLEDGFGGAKVER